MQPYQSPESGITFGQEHLDATDFIPPRVKVVQAMSQEAVDGKAKVGDFFNTLTGENYGSVLRFIPLTTFKNRVLIVRPERRDDINDALVAAGLPASIEGDGLQCRSLDMVQGTGTPGMDCAQCPLSEWRGAKLPPLCSESYNITAMNELGDLIILSFSKSAAKTGKKLISTMRMRREKPWTSVFELTTRTEKNDRGSFAVPDFRQTADRTDDALLRQAQTWLSVVTSRVIDVTPEDYTEEPAEDAAPF